MAWNHCASCTAPCRLKTGGGIYVAGGTVSETAALFARDHGITIPQGPHSRAVARLTRRGAWWPGLRVFQMPAGCGRAAHFQPLQRTATVDL